MRLPIKPPTGFDHLSGALEKFFQDNPHYETNVLVIMRFNESQQFEDIARSIEVGLKKYGLNALRADQKAYHDNLAENVYTYLIGCKYSVVVFEEIEERSFNPNVALETGYCLALNKRLLLLKDSRMPRLPTDIIGKIFKPFDVYNIKQSILKQVDQWIVDLGILGPQITWLFDKCEISVELLDKVGKKARCTHRYVGRPATAVPDPVPWTQGCLMRPRVARIVDGPRRV